MKKRAIECYAYLQQHPASRLCVVTHLGFLRVLAGVAILDGSFGKAQHLSLLQHLEGSNTGITHVRFEEEKQRWKLVTWNDISHIG
jgi:broad specificity phosphatase PhoE